MADVELYTLTKSSDANVYHFRDDRVEEMVEVDIDVENHALEIDGYDIAGITSLANKMSANFAPIETSTASTNYTSGQFLTLNGILLQATTNIATGETITIGTNVTQVNVADFLESLNSSVASLSAMLPAVPATVGKYVLAAERRVGGALIYTWEKDASGEWDYSHLTYWQGNGIWNFSKDDSGTLIPVISTSGDTRLMVIYDESYNGSPKVNYKNIWGVYIPDTVANVKVTLATGSVLRIVVTRLHTFPDNAVLYERLFESGWVSISTYTFNVDQIRQDAGGFTGDLFYFIEVAKTNYGSISASEVAQYYPGIEYIKGGT